MLIAVAGGSRVTFGSSDIGVEESPVGFVVFTESAAFNSNRRLNPPNKRALRPHLAVST